jgi:hypothetical protein
VKTGRAKEGEIEKNGRYHGDITSIFPIAGQSSRDILSYVENFLRYFKIITYLFQYSRMGERRGAYMALVGKPEERNHLEEPGVDRRIILKWLIERLGGGVD